MLLATQPPQVEEAAAQVAPLVKHLTACMDDRSSGRRAIVIDRDQHKAWCVGFSAAASLVIAAADQHRHSPG